MLKHWIASLLVGGALVGQAPRALADGKNEIRAVSFDDDAGTTRIHVRGAQTPTFTVYKLERPSRVVIDLPQAQLADVLRGHESASVLTPSTWAVSTIAAQQLDDGGQVVRVIVTLARPGRYDVKTEGNEIVVTVTSRDAAPKTASPEALAKAQADAAAATDAMKKNSAETAQQIEAAKAETARAKADAMKATDAATKAQTAAADQLARAKRERDEATRSTQAAQSEAQKAQADLARAKQDADAAKQAAAQEKADAAKAKLAAAQETEAVKREAQDAAVKARAEADAAMKAAQLAKADASKAQADASRAQADAQVAKADAASAKQQAMKERAEAEAARADAAKIRAEAAADKKLAEADKQKAEASRRDAEKLMSDAKSQLATLDKKSAAAQQLEDKARAAHAAAIAREEAARDAEQRAVSDRLAAEDAVKKANEARDRSSTQAKSERDRLAAEAKTAEAKLVAARQATDAAEARRSAAEAAQAKAAHELETSKSALASVEQQRSTTESAAAEASRKRGEAEAAARDASRRRGEAELAAAEATKQRGEAEAATRDAKVAKLAADKQREVAETAARTANDSKAKAEASLATLNAKRDAAEKAAQDVESRSRAEAKAQAQLAAAEARKAGDAELAKARGELAKLEAARKSAESDLADRRRAVASQQEEASKLKVAAQTAKDAATREETRRAQLADQRAVEEKQLAALKATPKPVVAPIVVATAVAAKLATPAQISDIVFHGADASGDVTITVGNDANVELGEITAKSIELIVDHAALAQRLERKLDVSKFNSPIRSIASFNDKRTPDRVRLIAELATPMTPTLDRDSKNVRWHFAASKHVAKPQPVVAQTTVLPAPVAGFGAASTPVAGQSVAQVPGRRHVYHGQTISIEIKDAPIHDLLRLIADTGHINIVVPDSINANVTVKLNRVPWDQALEVILQSHGLWYRKEGTLYRIATRKEIDTEDKEEAERRAAAVAAESPRPEILRLNYASANDLKGKLESMLSPKGKIEVEERTNALIVNDVTGNREQIARLALQLDTQTPQISVEARIVEARSTFTREFGIQWGGRALTGTQSGSATGLQFPSSVGLVGANTTADTVGTGVANPSDFAVNLPAATGAGEGGAIGLSLGSVSGNFNINLRLSALEDSGTVRIISAPKITVLNNKEAKISQGTSIPISVVSAAGAQTQFVQADLMLTVKPYVSQRDCAIAMDLSVTKNEPDFVNVGARGDPSILTKTAKTSMLVQDGETSVLGGIYTRNSGLAYKKIPFLADIPVLGWLFKDRRENDDRTEILVFITPKITNKATLHCQ